MLKKCASCLDFVEHLELKERYTSSIYIYIDLGCGWLHSWLPCSTNWKVTGAIPDAVMGDLSLMNLPSHYSPVVNSPSNLNERQGCLLGVKVAGVWG